VIKYQFGYKKLATMGLRKIELKYLITQFDEFISTAWAPDGIYSPVFLVKARNQTNV
jgi:hypothetical protein